MTRIIMHETAHPRLHDLNSALDHSGLLDISQVKGFNSGTKCWVPTVPSVWDQKGYLSYVNNALVTGTTYYGAILPLPITIGDKSLIIYRTAVCLRQADGNNEVNVVYIIIGQDDGTYSTPVSELVSFDSQDEHILDHDNVALSYASGDRAAWVQLRCQTVTAANLDIGSVLFEVAYI